MNATTITTQVLNATTINLPRLDVFLPDLNEVLGVDTGGFFSFSRVGHTVTAQLDVPISGIVTNSSLMAFDVPAPYAMEGLGGNFLTFPITMCINGVPTTGTLIVVDGQILISPEILLSFTLGDFVTIFSTAVTYLVLDA